MAAPTCTNLLRPISWKGVKGSARVKTGTMSYGRGLAGYIDTAAGRRLAFAIFFNDAEERAALDAAFDPHVRAIDPEVPVVAGPRPQAGAEADDGLGRAVLEAPRVDERRFRSRRGSVFVNHVRSVITPDCRSIAQGASRGSAGIFLPSSRWSGARAVS